MFKFTQKNLGWSRSSLIEIDFRTKEELFEHKFFRSYSNRPIFHQFTLKETTDGAMLLGEYYGGTEYHILGRIDGNIAKLGIPYREQNW